MPKNNTKKNNKRNIDKQLKNSKQKSLKEKNKKTKDKKIKNKKNLLQINNDNYQDTKPNIITTFQNIENDLDETYVGKLYADWCTHCRHMNNDWQIMQNNLDEQSENGIKVPIILNIEATYEDGFKDKNPTFVASGYPTIFKKKPNMPFEYYGGSRKSKDFIKWAKK